MSTSKTYRLKLSLHTLCLDHRTAFSILAKKLKKLEALTKTPSREHFFLRKKSRETSSHKMEIFNRNVTQA